MNQRCSVLEPNPPVPADKIKNYVVSKLQHIKPDGQIISLIQQSVLTFSI